MRVMERAEKQVNQVLEMVSELRNERSYRGVERLVQLLIQSLLDLGLMVISAVGGRTPEAYSEVGETLFNIGALSEGDAKLLRSMAGMRNILVHAYAVIDRSVISDASRSLLDDAPRIAGMLKAFLEGKGLDPPPTSGLAQGLEKVVKGRVKVALLFGGRVKGYSVRGDYDVAVYFGRPYSFYELGELAVDIAEGLGVPLEKLDVVCLDSAAPEIVLEALGGEAVYVEDPYAVFELKFRALTKLLDLRSGLRACQLSGS